MRLAFLPIVAGLCACAISAQASIIVTPTNTPQADEQNVLLDINTGPSLVIFGSTNQTGTLVSMSSSSLLVANPMGQSRVQAASGTFSDLTIEIPSGTFTDVIFAVNLPGSGSRCTDCVSFSANNNEPGGGTSTVSGGTFSLGPGVNFFTAVATGGETMNSFMITSSTGLGAIRQVRISGVAEIPEPVSLVLMASGFGALALLFRRMRKQT